MKINPVKGLQGTIKVPGDKSISHRAVMLGALAKGKTPIDGFLMGEDCLSTIRCFRQMGIDILIDQTKVMVHGKGLKGLSRPDEVLDVGNSGTTMRLISGILSGQDFDCHLTGDASIQKRPMGRIIKPLTLMGANIRSLDNNDLAPLAISPAHLHAIDYISPVASAQIKSGIMLASLYADGITSITEPYVSRNHSELMLNHFGGRIETEGTKVICHPVAELYANEIYVPSDISSAAFFMVAGLIVPNSEIHLLDVDINPTRDGILKVLQAMGGHIELDNIRTINGEKVADLIIRSSALHGTVVEGCLIPTLIDEIPVIAVAAAYATGTTIIKDAAELKVKESNRIDTMVNELKKMNVSIEATHDGMVIIGTGTLVGAQVESYHDHRVAMSLAIAALCAEGDTEIMNPDCISISYPNFYEHLKQLSLQSR